ncbi:hypothetical protein Tco_0462244 [Tanacetum coccineum]
MGNKELSTILEKESDEFIKSSVEDLVPIPSESADTSESDSDCDLPSCDDFSPIDVLEGKSMTFSNPLRIAIIFPSHMLSEFFFLISPIPWNLLFFSPLGVRILLSTPASPF